MVELSSEKPAEGERLYEGLGEALANTLDHAYPNTHVSFPGIHAKAWWAGAIYDEVTKTTHFMVYDRGIGLPARIPEMSFTWYEDMFNKMKGTVLADAEIIWAAIRSPRSGTNLAHRGEGLKQMADVVDSHPGSELRIVSGSGEVIYTGSGKKKLRALPAKFLGTLVEWRIRHE